MRVWHTILRAWASQRGANVAQSAAVALLAAALIGGILLNAPQLKTRVEANFACLVGVLGGGGADCASGSGSNAPAGQPAAPTTLDELGGEGCDAQCQIIGVLKGFGEGGWDALMGLWNMGKDLFLLLIGDEETWAKYKQLIEAFLADPVGVAKALLGEIAAPIIEDWQAGRYGEATGRLLFEVISTIGGPKGLDKLGKLGKLDDLGDVAKTVDRLPCVGAAPDAKAPGLARPAAEKCDLPAMPNKYDRSKSGYRRPDLDDETCTYCGKELTDKPNTVDSIEADHLVGLKDAWQRGGKKWTAKEWKEFSNDLENLVAACKSCNSSKQAKQLFDEWAPKDITPEARQELLKRIEVIVDRYKLENP